ncbi:class I SAM-dependent methyltransferase [Nonomuraea jiangxiensis]|nr:class I SAM-dependent methyltransferase [Nonomuraea jiangxiensis]
MRPLLYRLMYAVGFTPWDRDVPSAELVELVKELPDPHGRRALDLGCGTGSNAVYLAGLGWDVVGVDTAPNAIKQARRRAKAAGVDVRLLVGDVTELSKMGLGGPFDLLVDRGLMHALPGPVRVGYAREIAEVARPGSVLLMTGFWTGKAFTPGTPGLDAGVISGLLGAAWELERKGEAEDGRFVLLLFRRRDRCS